MEKLRAKLTYANVMATIAVFLTLGGGAIAATALKKGSVGTKQLKAKAVNEAKLATNARPTPAPRPPTPSTTARTTTRPTSGSSSATTSPPSAAPDR